MAGTIDRSLVNAFNDLLLFNIVRGKDSTGVASVDRDQHKPRKDTYLFKAPTNGFDIQQYKQYDRVVTSGKVCIIGHGRAATIGKVNRENAHPFEFSNLIGAHNGTIHNRTPIPDSNQFDTDSEGLYNAINTLGVEAVIGELVSGAWALTWYDKTDHSINFLRNKERPLCYAVVEDGKAIVWASEASLLHAACNRNGVKTEKMTWWVPEDRWMKFLIPPNYNGKFAEPIEKEVKGKEAPKVEAKGGYFSEYTSERKEGRRGGHLGGPVVQLAPVKGTQTAKVIVLTNNSKKTQRKVIMGWNGRQLDQQEFESRTGSTCAFSDQVVTFEDVIKGEEIAFLDDNTFVCAEFNTPEMHNWYFSIADKVH